MWGGRAPWWVLATMMSAAALAAGVATGLYWSPCAPGESGGAAPAYGGLAPACLERVTSGGMFPFPGPESRGIPGFVEATIGSLVLLGIGWAVFVASRRWSRGERVVAATPGVLTVALAAAALVQTGLQAEWLGTTVTTLLMVAIDLTALVAAAVIVQRTNGPDRIAHLVALWGVASFGQMRAIGDYIVTLTLANSPWDAPPGSGYVTAVAIGASALLAGWFGLWGRRVARRSPLLPRPATVPPAV